ncbi:ABC transporter ATP-binding protein [Microbacterium lushaniae]|uniref:ABC transporter ATP-binding protein n=1 Tax=Microbacterium lushaniae TaxID=2614639 RepID=A0A5J6L490_9MICO|nr:ABC transporter ATP-binding protein [Microbacterium lushaniae]
MTQLDSLPTMTSADAEREPLLRVRGLAVELPTGERSSVRALRGVTLSVRRGERVGIVGESGSGKSVTGRTIAGLLPTSPRVRVEGSVQFDGTELVGASARDWQNMRARNVGMIFQDPLTFLNPTMKIGVQVAESVRASGRVQRASVRGEVHRFLELAGFEESTRVANQFPHELSGGMRQRVLIAIAIAKKPHLIIADEPTTALDATVQAVVLKTLEQTVEELGNSLVLISHDLAVVSGMTDHLYVMYGGRVVESGPTREVMTDPRHPYTQALLRSVRSITDDDVDLYSMPPALREWLAQDDTCIAHDRRDD